VYSLVCAGFFGVGVWVGVTHCQQLRDHWRPRR
jgi:hypothetical protein